MKGDGRAYAETADQYGFGRYSIVLHAPSAIATKVQAFREAIGIGHMTTEPHVSIVSHLFTLSDRDELLSRLRRVAAEQSAVRIGFMRPLLHFAADAAVAGVIASPQLAAMRAAIISRLSGVLCSSRSLDVPWRAHLTIYQGGDPKVRKRAEHLASTLDLTSGFDALSLDLVGRLGTPPGGTRVIIERIPLT